MNKEILERFFANEASEAEVERVLEWFKAQELDPQKSQNLKELWQQIDESDYVPHDGNRLLDNIHRDIERSEVSHTEERLYNRKFHRPNYGFPVWPKVAAVLIVATALFAFWAVNSWQTESAIADEQQVTRVAKAGEKKTLTLSDGTTIQMNADSRLTFPAKFSDTEREVFLSGEAFFEVSEDSSRPFIVQTGALTTTVLGTSFNIKSYEEDESTDISLASGKLKVESSDSSSELNSYVLSPGEVAILTKKEKSLKKIRFDAKVKYGWTEGILVFRDANIAETFTKIERWYGVTVEIENYDEDINQMWKYRGVFKDESLENVLKGISYVQDFIYKIENESVKIVF